MTLPEAIAQLKDRGLPVTPRTEAALRASFAKYQDYIPQNIIDSALQKILDGVKSIAKPGQEVRGISSVEVGASPATIRKDVIQSLLTEFANPASLAQSLNLDFKIKTAAEVLRGAGRFLLGQTDVDEYPAWELYRLYPRKQPRLWAGDEGTEDPTLGSEFAGRWYAAAQAAGDPDAARILQDTGRMIALKSSGIWNMLGTMFADSLGNSYPPFAFNSGMEVDGVPYNECIQLGLLDPGEQPEATDFNFADLFKLPEAV